MARIFWKKPHFLFEIYRRIQSNENFGYWTVGQRTINVLSVWKHWKINLIFELLVWQQFSSDFHDHSTKQNLNASRREHKRNFSKILIFGEVIQKRKCSKVLGHPVYIIRKLDPSVLFSLSVSGRPHESWHGTPPSRLHFSLGPCPSLPRTLHYKRQLSNSRSIAIKLLIEGWQV